MSRVLITSALPYANGPLHFGHIAGAYLPADAYARFERLQGNEVLYICGSDEYGVAITLSAERAKRTPKEHVDHFHALNKAFFEKLHFSFDHYSRTTCLEHAPLTIQFFQELLANGYIEKRSCQQLYSETEKRFLADRYVVGICPHCGYSEARGDECQKCGSSYEATDLKSPRSKITGSPLTLKLTDHWFLLFDKFQDKLRSWLSHKKWKNNVMNFAMRYVDDLKARAITRDSDWGVAVPLEEAKGKVFYVWFDAPIGYLSATKEWAKKIGKPDAWKEYWCDSKTKLVQFIGKDNIPFHAVFFPAMIMGQSTEYVLVDELPANEFYNLEGRQFSKSEGWYIDLESFFQKFTVDQIRYAIASNAPETQDADFSWKDFQSRCNADLLGKYGNLANRVLIFVQNRCGGKIPAISLPDAEFHKSLLSLAQEIQESYQGFHLRKCCQLIMQLAAAGNVYFDAKKPWLLAKDPTKQEEMLSTIGLCLECLKILALVSSPIIPDSAQKLWQMLGNTSTLASENWQRALKEVLPADRLLCAPHVLFARVEDAQIQEEIQKLQGKTPGCVP